MEAVWFLCLSFILLWPRLKTSDLSLKQEYCYYHCHYRPASWPRAPPTLIAPLPVHLDHHWPPSALAPTSSNYHHRRLHHDHHHPHLYNQCITATTGNNSNRTFNIHVECKGVKVTGRVKNKKQDANIHMLVKGGTGNFLKDTWNQAQRYKKA